MITRGSRQASNLHGALRLADQRRPTMAISQKRRMSAPFFLAYFATAYTHSATRASRELFQRGPGVPDLRLAVSNG